CAIRGLSAAGSRHGRGGSLGLARLPVLRLAQTLSPSEPNLIPEDLGVGGQRSDSHSANTADAADTTEAVSGHDAEEPMDNTRAAELSRTASSAAESSMRTQPSV